MQDDPKIRLYLDHPLGPAQSLPLTRDQAGYLFRVMRLGPGAEIAVFNGHDGEWRAEVTAAGRHGGALECRSLLRPQSLPPDLWLLFAPIRKERTDFIVEKAAEMGNTRSAAALELWRPHLDGALVAIGNAPTALFHLLNMLEDPACPRPAAIIGCPVGFVGAAESKDALMQDLPVPSMIVQGRLGGSAITVAAVNALASFKE